MLQRLFSSDISGGADRCRWRADDGGPRRCCDLTELIYVKLFVFATAIFWLQGIAYAQTDVPLPQPRALPPEMEKAAERCLPYGNCRARTLERPGDNITNEQLRHELERLRQERERLRQLRNQPSVPAPPIDLPESELLNQRVQRLLMQWVLEGPIGVPASAEPAPQRNRNVNASAPAKSSTSQTPRSEKASPLADPSNSETSSAKGSSRPGEPLEKPASESAPAAPATKPTDRPVGSKPLAPLELGQSLFRAGNYEAALGAFRLVETNGLSREDRLLVQYLQAMCLRRLGRDDEAAKLYREIANSRSDFFATECAQWQLSHLRWQQATQQRLQQIRTWRSQREPSR